MSLINLYDDTTARLRASGDYVWPLALRLIMFWEIWESGVEKYTGDNWFQYIPNKDWQMGFPWPFSEISVDLNWMLATWGELVLSVMLVLGLFTRFAAISLIVLIVVATAAVHWPNDWSSISNLWEAYAISYRDGYGFKLALLFVLLLLPLVFHGGGKLSLDRLLLVFTARTDRTSDTICDAMAGGLALLVLAVSVVFVEPYWGATFLVAAALMIASPKFLNRS